MGKEDNYMILSGVINIGVAMSVFVLAQVFNQEPTQFLNWIVMASGVVGALTIAKHRKDKQVDDAKTSDIIVTDLRLRDLESRVKTLEEAVAHILRTKSAGGGK